MPRRRREEEPETPGEALRLMAKYGRRSDRARDDEKRFAQMAYDKHGASFLERLGGEITVDERGRVHTKDEYARWDNGVLLLRLVAQKAEVEGWTGGDVAEHLDALCTEGGIELAA